MRLALLSLLVVALAACSGGGQSPIATVPGAPNVAHGDMRFTVTLAGPVDTSKYHYWIYVNTSGNGETPESGNAKSNWSDVTDALSQGENGAATEAWEFLKSANCPTCVPAAVALLVTPSQLKSVDGGTSLSVTVDRAVFAKASSVWLFNVDTEKPGGAYLDSPGGCSNCFTSPQLPVTTAFTTTVAAQGNHANVPAGARIVSVQVSNNP